MSIDIFGFPVHVYGFLYVLGFAFVYVFVTRVLRPSFIDKHRYFDVLFWAFITGVLFGRLGYVLFYNLPFYIDNPLHILMTWEGGMSIHGGMIGGVLGAFVACYKKWIPFWKFLDVSLVAFGAAMAMGRLGNWLNSELPGTVAHVDLPWLYEYPQHPDQQRHPYAIYAILHNLFTFGIMWRLYAMYKTHLIPGQLSAIFGMIYAFFRFVFEYVREPEIVYEGIISQGQVLSLVLFVVSLLIFRYFAKIRKKTFTKS